MEGRSGDELRAHGLIIWDPDTLPAIISEAKVICSVLYFLAVHVQHLFFFLKKSPFDFYLLLFVN